MINHKLSQQFPFLSLYIAYLCLIGRGENEDINIVVSQG